MTVDLSADMMVFFHERMAAALSRKRLRLADATEFYLVNLLTGFARLPAEHSIGEPFVERMADALAAPTDQERYRRFRDLGDHALYVCGFFSEHLAHRGVSRNYVVAMGGRAYVAAAELAGRASGSGLARVYPELAAHFDPLAHVLDEVRETTSLRTPQDIIRLYERWRATGSALLAERLEREGVFPQVTPPRGRLLH